METLIPGLPAGHTLNPSQRYLATLEYRIHAAMALAAKGRMKAEGMNSCLMLQNLFEGLIKIYPSIHGSPDNIAFQVRMMDLLMRWRRRREAEKVYRITKAERKLFEAMAAAAFEYLRKAPAAQFQTVRKSATNFVSTRPPQVYKDE